MARKTVHQPSTFVKRLTEYAAQPTEADEFVIPDDLTTLSDEDLSSYQERATETFDALYGDGKGLSEDDLTALSALTKGIRSLAAESETRAQAENERSERAAALAAEVRPEATLSAETATDEDAEAEDETDAEPGDEEAPETDAAETVTASGGARVSLATVRARAARRGSRIPAGAGGSKMADVVTSAETGKGLDWSAMADMLNRRLNGFNESLYKSAAQSGRQMHEQKGLAVFHRNFDPSLVVTSGDQEHIDQVLRNAMDETRLPGGALTASGGWCAPSETLYTMCEMESRDGLYSLPEIGVKRGGISRTLGPDFPSLFADITGFHYTEAQDVAGTYAVDANGIGTGAAGDKPVYRVDCPDFDEFRLEADGMHIVSGLLQARGFPEMQARTLRGAMVVRDHRTAGRILTQVAAGSTAVTMTAGQVGATAPLLDAIEKQAEHYKYVNRLARSTSLEAVFPFWVRGVVRSDLARRLGVLVFDVPDSLIDNWFRQRGIAPQYVYNWQDLTGGAAAFTEWPATITFLLYSAGTWVKGAADVISLDTLYDSVMLGQNDFTALFVEDAWFVAQMCHDSRAVTVAIEPDGATHAGVLIEADGTETPPAV